MEDSVQGITQRHSTWNPRSSATSIARLEEQLDEARREEAKINAELKAIRERETFRHPPRPGGYSGTLQRIASQARAGADEFRWFTYKPREEEEAPLTAEEFQELLALLRDAHIAKWESQDVCAVDIASIPRPDAVAPLLSAEAEARSHPLTHETDSSLRHLRHTLSPGFSEASRYCGSSRSDLSRFKTAGEALSRMGGADSIRGAGRPGSRMAESSRNHPTTPLHR